MTTLTQLFAGVNAGDRAALDQLLTLLYDELHQMAQRRLRPYDRQITLNPTGLVHESYLRLLKAGRLAVTDRPHFLVYAAHVMRSVVLDLIRRQQAQRHGGGALHVTLSTEHAESVASEEQMLRINEALDELSHSDPRLVQVVELRYFVGLSEPEIAETLGVAVRTVGRDWQKAKLLLQLALNDAR